jgi:hypothetical protein
MHLANQPPPRLNDKGLEPTVGGLAVELPNQLAESQP